MACLEITNCKSQITNKLQITKKQKLRKFLGLEKVDTRVFSDMKKIFCQKMAEFDLEAPKTKVLWGFRGRPSRMGFINAPGVLRCLGHYLP